MAQLITWDDTNKRFYETGVSNGVLYPYDGDAADPTKAYNNGVAWNGLTGVTESPSGAEETPLYANNGKYLSLRSAEEFGCTIEAYTYPDEWAKLDGSLSPLAGLNFGQQSRGVFGLSYKTILGNDGKLDAFGYKLHLIYGATASPSERAYATVNDSPEAITFSWEAKCTGVNVADITVGTDTMKFKPVSCITINSKDFSAGQAATNLATLESKLYGTKNTTPTADVPGYLPLPNEVYTILTAVG